MAFALTTHYIILLYTDTTLSMIDLETNGGDPKTADPIEFGAVKVVSKGTVSEVYRGMFVNTYALLLYIHALTYCHLQLYVTLEIPNYVHSRMKYINLQRKCYMEHKVQH